MYSKTQTQLKTLSQNLLNNQQLKQVQDKHQQKLGELCKTCEDTETGLPTGLVYWNDIGASGVEKFTLSDCPTCKGEKIVYG